MLEILLRAHAQDGRWRGREEGGGVHNDFRFGCKRGSERVNNILIILLLRIIIDNFCIALFSGVPKLAALYNIL